MFVSCPPPPLLLSIRDGRFPCQHLWCQVGLTESAELEFGLPPRPVFQDSVAVAVAAELVSYAAPIVFAVTSLSDDEFFGTALAPTRGKYVFFCSW